MLLIKTEGSSSNTIRLVRDFHSFTVGVNENTKSVEFKVAWDAAVDGYNSYEQIEIPFFAPTSGISFPSKKIIGWGYDRTVHGVPMDVFCKELFNPVMFCLTDRIFSDTTYILNWTAFEEEVFESFRSLLDYMTDEGSGFQDYCKEKGLDNVEYLRTNEITTFLNALTGSFIENDY